MDNDLQYFIHFFNDQEHLFKTITMAGISQMDEICNIDVIPKKVVLGKILHKASVMLI